MNRRFSAASAASAAVTALAALTLLTVSPAALADDAPQGRITVEVNALRSAKGVVRCSLFASADGFPKDTARALALTVAPSIANGRALCIFDNVKPGTYAVGFIHDENNNGKLDTNFLGMPTEGYGASNDARGTMGPPKFDAAAFNHGTQTALHLKTAY
jgi:uncharacterized protein (DUF2141 family)